MRPITVLLVEDHAGMREALRLLLAQEFEVLDAVDRGDLVLESVERLRPDAIVLDVSLPGRSGLKLLPDLRARFPHMCVVMLTANDETAYRKAALRLGADAFLSKSSLTDLLQVVRAATEKLARA